MKIKVDATGQIIYVDHEDQVEDVLRSFGTLNGNVPLFIREYSDSEAIAVSNHPISVPDRQMDKFLETGNSSSLTLIEDDV
jgi:hypothetical protein